MDEFIQLAARQLGIGSDEIRSATGSIMKLVKDHLDDTSFSQISSKLPGVQSLLSDSDDSAAAGGLIGSLTSLAGSLLGDKAGGLASIAAILAKSGISLEKSADFMKMLIDFLKARLGGDLFETVMAKLPDLIGTRE